MNRLDARGLMRSRLNDPATGGTYDDTRLNLLFNQGLALVQKEIMKVRPLAFMEWTLRDVVKDQARYPLPVGTMKLIYVGTRSGTTGAFTRLERKPFDYVLDGTMPTRVYAHAGREIVIGPTPDSTVDDGMRTIVIPTIELGDDTSSTEDKGLPRPLDMAAVVWGVELATPESSPDRADVVAERKSLLDDLGQWFIDNADGNEELRLDLVKYPVGVR